MRQTKFRLESLGYEDFQDYMKNEEWNGWDCPYFTFEQAEKVLKCFNQLRQIIGTKDLAFYDSGTDSFIFPIDINDSPEIFNAIVIEGQKYYPVGAFSWIWEEAVN